MAEKLKNNAASLYAGITLKKKKTKQTETNGTVIGRFPSFTRSRGPRRSTSLVDFAKGENGQNEILSNVSLTKSYFETNEFYDV